MDLTLQKNIGLIMDKGFEKAARSFSQMVNRNLSFTNSSTVLINHEQEFYYSQGEEGKLMVLTTNLIGDLSGRSFLILNEKERAEICRSVSPTKVMDEKLQEALLLEIDNIISASVIGQLADDLGIEAYGDVPNLEYVNTKSIQQFLSSAISSESQTSIVLCNATFLLDKQEYIHPQFIWKLSAEVFQMIKQQSVL